MGIKTRISNAEQRNESMDLSEQLYREERNYRADKLVEKWSTVPEIGHGIENMNANTARNLAILLENQTRAMKRMTEAQLSANFYGYTPENMLRLIRLSYPNSIRGKLFTEFAMESAHDSIKYIMPVYTNGQDQIFGGQHMEGKLDGDYLDHGDDPYGIMYESTESRYATEMVEAKIADGSNLFTVTCQGGAFGEAGVNYIDGYTEIYAVDVRDGKKVPLAMQTVGGNINRKGVADDVRWMFSGAAVPVTADEETKEITQWIKIDGVNPKGNGVFAVPVLGCATETGEYTPLDTPVDTHIFAVARYNSEVDLQGQYLGEVELVMKDYHFRPRIISLGVSWTQLTELVLDTSFNVSAEEMLMDSAAQEIKKTLDFQAIKYANAVQRTNGLETVTFNAIPADGGQGNKDSYFQTAQNIQQAIDRVGDVMYNKIMRGGVTAIVGGPAAVNYLKLNKGWSDRGKMPPIGGYQVGELDGTPVFKVPSAIIAEDELLTTWKNDVAESDVSIAIGTLMPFYSTGTIQRKTFYKEAGVARFEDTKALNPQYLGRIKIKNIRELGRVYDNWPGVAKNA